MQLEQLNIVAIGGGHGLGRTLATLACLGDKLTGIVTTTDNGGSSGRLRRRTSSIAWGDLRNCLTQLADTDTIGSQLFNFRFTGEDELSGHNLGNLVLYGLENIQSRPLDSIELVRRMLGVKAKVYPMSEFPTDLMAFYHKGRCRVGEMSVDDMPDMPRDLILAPLVKSFDNVLADIENADIVILGPGSFLTSVVPPLLVRDIAKAIHNSNAKCLFIDNLVKEKSPAAHLAIDEKLAWLEGNIKYQLVDMVLTQDTTMTSELIEVICLPLSAEGLEHHHDKAKLINALRVVVSKVTNTPIDIPIHKREA